MMSRLLQILPFPYILVTQRGHSLGHALRKVSPRALCPHAWLRSALLQWTSQPHAPSHWPWSAWGGACTPGAAPAGQRATELNSCAWGWLKQCKRSFCGAHGACISDAAPAGASKKQDANSWCSWQLLGALQTPSRWRVAHQLQQLWGACVYGGRKQGPAGVPEGPASTEVLALQVQHCRTTVT